MTLRHLTPARRTLVRSGPSEWSTCSSSSADRLVCSSSANSEPAEMSSSQKFWKNNDELLGIYTWDVTSKRLRTDACVTSELFPVLCSKNETWLPSRWVCVNNQQLHSFWQQPEHPPRRGSSWLNLRQPWRWMLWWEQSSENRPSKHTRNICFLKDENAKYRRFLWVSALWHHYGIYFTISDQQVCQFRMHPGCPM